MFQAYDQTEWKENFAHRLLISLRLRLCCKRKTDVALLQARRHQGLRRKLVLQIVTYNSALQEGICLIIDCMLFRDNTHSFLIQRVHGNAGNTC